MMGSLSLVTNATALTQAYRGLSFSEDICLLKHCESCDSGLARVVEQQRMVEKPKTSFLSAWYDWNQSLSQK